MLFCVGKCAYFGGHSRECGAKRSNLRQGVTDISQQVYDLHMLMFLICVGIAALFVMFVSIIRHRKSRGVKPANFHESVKVEIAWTVAPFVIFGFDAVIPVRQNLDRDGRYF